MLGAIRLVAVLGSMLLPGCPSHAGPLASAGLRPQHVFDGQLVADRYDGSGAYAGRTARGADGAEERYDKQGRYSGSSRRAPNGATERYDGAGRYTGSTRRGPGGSTERHDGAGRYAGSSRPGPGGATQHYDAAGRYAGNSIRKPDGTVEHYDASGRYTGTTRPRPRYWNGPTIPFGQGPVPNARVPTGLAERVSGGPALDAPATGARSARCTLPPRSAPPHRRPDASRAMPRR